MTTMFIYALNDPTTGQTRYIGVTKDPQQRLYDHLSRARKHKSHKDCWIRKLLILHRSPILEVLDEIPSMEWKFWEREYIRLYRIIGFDLTNLTDGGDGGDIWCGRKHSLETRAKMSADHRGKVFSTEHRIKLSQRRVSSEWREKIRLSKIGVSIPSGRDMRGEKNPMFGKKHSLSALEKMRGPRK
jgi:hypothetical protein